VHTGLYLTRLRLGQRPAAARAFGNIVEQGLDQKRLGLKVLFRPGTAAIFSPPGPAAQPYSMWMNELGRRAATRTSCLDVIGHTSPSGAEPVNERLSLMRAEMVAGELQKAAPKLAKRLASSGVGSKQALIGTGRDDLSDALDRRVEFVVRNC
jgi:flagellar motor protein MotB